MAPAVMPSFHRQTALQGRFRTDQVSIQPNDYGLKWR